MNCVDDIPDNTLVQVILIDGTRFLGVLRRSAGWPWVSVDGKDAFSLTHLSPEFAKVARIDVLSTEPSIEDQNRKYGEIAYKDPRTRQEYEETLWQLAAMVSEAGRAKNISAPNYRETSLRAMQLENQFNAVADKVELAKTKRRYMLFCALMHKRGEPLPNPLDLVGSPLDALQFQVPKFTDCDPDPKVRKSRSLSPPIAYPTKSEAEASLRGARYKLASRRLSNKTRAKFERIVQKREKQLQSKLYREAVAAREGNHAAT